MKSQNGWPVYASSAKLVPLSWITGRVAPGDVHAIFDAFCDRFHAEVEPIIKAHSWGWANRPIRGAMTTSNHASGTAIDLNAPAHPLGKRGTFSGHQVAAIRRILADFGGAIRWGGDYKSRADEMHFEVNVSPARLSAIAAEPTPSPTPKPTPAPVPEEDDDMAKNSGFYYKRSDGSWVYLIVNTVSGFVHEYSGGKSGTPIAGTYNNPVAAAFDTGSYAPISESHANAIKRSLELVLNKKISGDLSVTINEAEVES